MISAPPQPGSADCVKTGAVTVQASQTSKFLDDSSQWAAVKPSKCVSAYLLHSEPGAVGLQHTQRHGCVVREVGVVWAGTEEVKGDGEVKREHAHRQVPALQHGGQAAVQEDAGGGGVRAEMSEPFLPQTSFCSSFVATWWRRETSLRFMIHVYGFVLISQNKGCRHCCTSDRIPHLILNDCPSSLFTHQGKRHR